MDLFTALKNRRSCRRFLPEPLAEETLEQILEAATWAPSPLNLQPWEFIVVSNQHIKEAIFDEADRCRRWALEQSGWKWLDQYPLDFLKTAPTIVAVIGNPQKTGVDQFMKDGYQGYQQACAAAVQNMLLAAQALGLGSLWFTFYDKQALSETLEIKADRTLVALVCLGRAAKEPKPVPGKEFQEKTKYL